MSALVEECFPVRRRVAAEDVAAELDAAHADQRLSFGDERVLDFFDSLGRRMLGPAARLRPELAALGFFLRRGSLGRRVAEAAEAGDPSRVRVPRGVALHIPPGNVAALLCYSWALSAAAGNANVVRLSTRPSPVTDAILQVLDEYRDGVPEAVSRTQKLVRYDRESTATAAFSSACQVRVVWGGDATVTALRALPLPPGAKEITFPDRSSFAIISASGWSGATVERQRAAVSAFYRDSYWYDQAACSSPRTIFFVGPESEADRAREDFLTLLAAEVAVRAPEMDAAMAVEKRVATYGLALRGVASAVRFAGNALATVDLSGGRGMLRHWAGAGTFALGRVASLLDLVPLIDRRDQTVIHFGFAAAELRGFVAELRGRGVDRLVPFGAALQFDAVWDGYDLLREFSRVVTVSMDGEMG